MTDKDWILFNNVEVHKKRPLLRANGQLIDLEDSEYRVLSLLLSQPEKVFDKYQLLNSGWPQQQRQVDCVKACISSLRKKLNDKALTSYYITTVGRTGYQWIAHAQQKNQPKSKQTVYLLTAGIVFLICAAILAYQPMSADGFDKWRYKKLELPSRHASNVKISYSGQTIVYQDPTGALNMVAQNTQDQGQLFDQSTGYSLNDVIDYQWHPEHELLATLQSVAEQSVFAQAVPCQLRLIDIGSKHPRPVIPCPPMLTTATTFLRLAWQADRQSLLLSDITSDNQLVLYRYQTANNRWQHYLDYQLTHRPINIELLTIDSSQVVVVRGEANITQLYQLHLLPAPELRPWLESFDSIAVVAHESPSQKAFRYLTSEQQVMIFNYVTEESVVDLDFLVGVNQLHSHVGRHLVTSRIPGYHYLYSEKLDTPLIISSKSVTMPIPQTSEGRYLLTTSYNGSEHRDQIILISSEGDVIEVDHQPFRANTITSFDVNERQDILFTTRAGVYLNEQLIIPQGQKAVFLANDSILYLMQNEDTPQLFQQPLDSELPPRLITADADMLRTNNQGYCYLKTDVSEFHCHHRGQRTTHEIESIPRWLDYHVTAKTIIAIISGDKPNQLLHLEYERDTGKLLKQYSIDTQVAIANPAIRQAIDYLPTHIEHRLDIPLDTQLGNGALP